jgi:ABC-2 type transport system permease protein
MTADVTGARPSAGRAFLAVLGRDVFVTGKELPAFLAQVLVQPFFFLLVFVTVLGRSGFVSPEYGSIMLPGLIALNAMFGALQSVAFPLVFEFSYSREIEDRLLAPLPIPLVAVEKMVFAALRGLVASLLMVPIGLLMVDVAWPVSGLAPALLMMVLGAVLGATLGMLIGTSVPPRRINVLFAVVFTPLLFTGSVQYPWLTLEDLRWFQVLSALNPLTYVSEGIRAVLVPQVPHLPFWLCVLAALAAALLSGLLGVRGFLRRALD